MKIYELAVHKPVIVTIGLVTLLALGLIAVDKLPIEFFPQMDFPFIGVFVPYPNSIPAHVEEQIAKPLEEVFVTLGDIKEIFSESSTDGAFVGVLFDFGRDVNVLRMEIKEKIDQIRGDLPEDIQHIQLFTFNSNDQPIMVGRISAKEGDLMGNYDLLERTIINPLERIPGVGRVQIDGIEPEEIAIYLEIDKIKAHKVDVDALFQQVQNMNVTASLGELKADGLRYTIRGLGNFNSVDEVENLVINESGLRLKDIATIYFGEPLMTYGRHLNSEPCVAFWIQKASGANSVEVAERVHVALEKINADPRLGGVDVFLFWDQAEQIVNSLTGLQQAGIMGAVLAVFILYFFLRRLTTTLIVAVSIPFALLCTCGFLYFSGRSLNILTMMGLMLGVGMLVDNAIVVLESIFRHQSAGTESRQAAIIGSREVVTAVIAATLTSIIVFAPIIITQDSSPIMKYLSHVGITISVAILFSLLISLTLIPFLTSRLLKPKKARTSKLIEKSKRGYVRVLNWTAIKHPYVTGFLIVPVIVAAGFVLPFVTKAVSFNMEEGELIENLFVRLELADNLHYRQTEKYIDAVEVALEEHREELGIKHIYSYYASNIAQTTLYFDSKYLSEDRIKKTRERLREILPELAGCRYLLGDDQGGGAGGVSRLEVTIFGEDMRLLEDYANIVRRRLTLMEGMEDVRTSIETGAEEIKIALKRELAHQYDVNPQAVSGIMNLTFRGMDLRKFQTEEREVPMGIILDPADRVGLYNLKNLMVGMQDGRETTLGTVADLEITRGPVTIERQDQKAAITISGTFDREKYEDMHPNVAAVMNSMQFPVNYHWSFGNRYQSQQQQKNDMMLNLILSIACIYLVMASLFESLLHPMIILGCLPFSAIGAVLALTITGTDINLMAIIGAVILIGIVVNNGIVLFDHVNNFRRNGETIPNAILKGGEERFRPIVMTAATTILGLLPMAVGKTNVVGTQYYPLAIVVMGGLAVGTALTLVALPTYYIISERQWHWFLGVWKRATGRRGAQPAEVGTP